LRVGLLLLPVLTAVLLMPACLSAQSETNGFGDFETFDEADFSEQIEAGEATHSGDGKGLPVALGVLAVTVLAGVFVRFGVLRRLRVLFLLGSVVILGFAFGGCPCSISSFQNMLLWAMGEEVCGNSLVWFLGLIPITYLFGRVWCGWVCHLGALQEFIHIPNKLAFLQGNRARQIMRWSRYALFIALIVQLAITRENLFIHIDPFKVAFNLSSYYTTGWILLGLMLVSSLYIHRPFCRSVCPVGVVLGWISRLPGAAVLGRNEDCSSCRLCSSACAVQAIQRDRESKEVTFHSSDCMMCGDCLDQCRKDAIGFVREGLPERTRGAPQAHRGRVRRV